MCTIRLNAVKNCQKKIMDAAGQWLQFQTRGNNINSMKCFAGEMPYMFHAKTSYWNQMSKEV